MYRFYVDEANINKDYILIEGSDVNHIKNVLRLNPKEQLIVCDGKGKDYNCIIEEIRKDSVLVNIIDSTTNETELATKIYLFQGLPKKDKMEWIIQKAVELGVYEIIPVSTKRTIVKISDKKKERNKLDRWQTIATSAAKQSNRGIIPSIHEVLTFSDALDYARDLEIKLIPYENAKGIEATREIIHNLKGTKSIGIFIGPEGGFEEDEVDRAKEQGFAPVTLGRRILRTETAGLAILSMIMLELED